MTTGREISPAENYVVCVRVDQSIEVVPGSVRERCFACSAYVMLYPDSQRLMNERKEEHIKIVCSSCYMSAPDKDRIRPSDQLPKEIRDYIHRER